MTQGYEAVLHRSLTEQILFAGAPRTVAIVNGTLAAAIGIGMHVWLLGLVMGIVGHIAAVWGAKADPLFLDVFARHLRLPALLDA